MDGMDMLGRTADLARPYQTKLLLSQQLGTLNKQLLDAVASISDWFRLLKAKQISEISISSSAEYDRGWPLFAFPSASI